MGQYVKKDFVQPTKGICMSCQPHKVEAFLFMPPLHIPEGVEDVVQDANGQYRGMLRQGVYTLYLHSGDFVIINPSGKKRVLSGHQFEKIYEPVKIVVNG
jgi:hypothetical protein